MDFAFNHLGCKTGIGIDIDPKKVAKTQALGYEALVGDLTRSEIFSGRAQIAILSHVLEHIPGIDLANKILNTATLVTSKFVLVRQPWFDCTGPLAQMGLKLYWSDWRGHPNHMSSLQMYLALKRIMSREQIASFSIWGHSPIINTDHSAIVPLDSPQDRHHYNPQTDAPKLQNTELGFDCFKELIAFIGVAPELNTKTLPPPFRSAKQLFYCAKKAC